MMVDMHCLIIMVILMVAQLILSLLNKYLLVGDIFYICDVLFYLKFANLDPVNGTLILENKYNISVQI